MKLMKLLFVGFISVLGPHAYTISAEGNGVNPEELIRPAGVYFDDENNCRRVLYEEDRECTEKELEAVSAVLEGSAEVAYFDAESNCRIRVSHEENRECTAEELEAVSAVLADNAFTDFRESKNFFTPEVCKKIAMANVILTTTFMGLLFIPPTTPVALAALSTSLGIHTTYGLDKYVPFVDILYAEEFLSCILHGRSI